jgi:hypothetical protein
MSNATLCEPVAPIAPVAAPAVPRALRRDRVSLANYHLSVDARRILYAVLLLHQNGDSTGMVEVVDVGLERDKAEVCVLELAEEFPAVTTWMQPMNWYLEASPRKLIVSPEPRPTGRGEMLSYHE